MDYFKKTCSELIAICKEKGIKGYSGKKKNDIIKMIQELKPIEKTLQTIPIKTTIDSTSRKEYETLIINHSNYSFLPVELKKNWVTVSKAGKNPRKDYWDKLLKELIDTGKIPIESKYVNVARFIHPTKKHTCKQCFKECSIYYEYPTANTWKWLNSTFKIEKNIEKTIFEIYNTLTTTNKNLLFETYFGISIDKLEIVCKSDTYSGNKLSPGVMSNAPDRLDGFHCYNSNCGCRSKDDKGRSNDNMKSYTRDRRAYEYFSDGNCLLANSIMGNLNTINSICPTCKKSNMMTGDHIGPLSLGFIHDPVNLQACCKLCNTKKNNRITEEDVITIKSMEEKGINMVSWWAKDAWEINKDKDITTIKKNLDKNTKKFLSIIIWLKNNKLDLLESFIDTTYMKHDISYKINKMTISPTGSLEYKYVEIVSEKKTKVKQKERTKEILMEINEKTNRKIKISLTDKEISSLSIITLDTFKNTICKILV